MEPLEKNATPGSDEARDRAGFPMKTVIAIILPLWALAMIVVGAERGAVWWILVGIVIGAIGLMMLPGSPLADLIMKDR